MRRQTVPPQEVTARPLAAGDTAGTAMQRGQISLYPSNTCLVSGSIADRGGEGSKFSGV